MAGRPELPLSALTQLQDSTRRLAADIKASAALGRVLNPALSIAERFSALDEDVARAGRRLAGLVSPRSGTGDCGRSSAPP